MKQTVPAKPAHAAVRLLLDPRLAVHAEDRIRRQANAVGIEVIARLRPARSEENHRSSALGPVRIASEASVEDRLLLRDASDAHPDAVVVILSEADRAYLEGKGRRVSLLERVQGGYELELDRTIAPPLNPMPPSRWRGGVPQVTHPELVSLRRRQATPSLERWRPQPTPDEQILTRADDAFEVPAFPITSASEWLAEHGLVVPPRNRGELFEVADFVAERTYVWWHKEQVYALGPAAPKVGALIGHDVIESPVEIASWFAALTERNPFDGDGFADVREGLTSIGVSLEASLSRCRGAEDEHETHLIKRGPIDLPAWSSEQESTARTVLGSLALREMQGVPNGWWSLATYFRLAATAPLGHLPRGPREICHVLASLGGGRVLRIRVAQYAGAGVGPLRWGAAEGRDRFRLDGDGTRAVIESLYDERLEGTIASRRRRCEEARAGDDWYDD